jgi:hypothetical protein
MNEGDRTLDALPCSEIFLGAATKSWPDTLSDVSAALCAVNFELKKQASRVK